MYRKLRACAELFFFTVISLLFSISAYANEKSVEKVLAAIDENKLRTHIQFLSSPELEGRFALSEHYLKAAQYIQSQLKDMGLAPANMEDSFFQKCNLYRIGPDSIKAFSIINPEEKVTFSYGRDFIAAAGVSMEAGKAMIRNKIAFLGYGISAPEYHHDDYQGVDVKDKVVVIIEGEPQYKNLNFVQRIKHIFKRKTRYANTRRKARYALYEKGVQGIINMSQLNSGSKKWKKWVKGMQKLGGYAVSPFDKDSKAQNYRFLYTLNHEAGNLLLKKLFNKDLKSLDKEYPVLMKKKLLEDSFIEIEGDYISKPFPSMNVIGEIEGCDPNLKDEYIIIGAHLDHIGKRKGKICPGADDNASGCSALLEIARAFRMGQKPKRSILLIFFTAEEIGGLGSYFYTEHPLQPLEKTKVMINLDCIGRSGLPDKNPNILYLIGSERYSSRQKEICKKINDETEHFQISSYYDEGGEKPLLDKADQYYFHLKEVPTLFFYTGEVPDHHRPSDREEKIEYQKLARVCRLIYSTAIYLVNLD